MFSFFKEPACSKPHTQYESLLLNNFCNIYGALVCQLPIYFSDIIFCQHPLLVEVHGVVLFYFFLQMLPYLKDGIETSFYFLHISVY